MKYDTARFGLSIQNCTEPFGLPILIGLAYLKTNKRNTALVSQSLLGVMTKMITDAVKTEVIVRMLQ
jgi:hypothetical protein